MINNIIHEFCPWNQWVLLPGNRQLPLHEQMRKYEVERNTHFHQMMAYETLEQVKAAAAK